MTPNKGVSVYALYDARELDVIRYVGFTRVAVIVRLYGHLKESENGRKSHRLNWIRKVLSENSTITVKTLAIVETPEEAARIEVELIRRYRAKGCKLVNDTEGGEGANGWGGRLLPEALARRNETLNSPEYLEKRSAQSTDYWANEENRQHQSEAMSAHFESPAGEAHRKIIIATNKRVQTGLKRSDETREKMRQRKLGKPHARERDAEWQEKIAAKQRGVPRGSHPWKPERRAAFNAAVERRRAAQKVIFDRLQSEKKSDDHKT